MDVDEFQSHWLTERLTMSQVEEMAVYWLESGFDGPCLRELAWRHDSWDEVSRLIVGAMSELGQPLMTEDDARYWWASEVATRIVSGTIDPYVGANKIYWECWSGVIPRPQDIKRFYLLALEAVQPYGEDIPTQELKARIKEEAESFLRQRREPI